MPATIRFLEKATILVGQHGYEITAVTELQRLPYLLHAIHTLVEMRDIRTLLFPDLEKQDQETNDTEQQVASISEPVPSTPLPIMVTPPGEPELVSLPLVNRVFF